MRPCRKPGFEEAGPTYRDITAVVRLASSGRNLSHRDHPTAAGSASLCCVRLIAAQQHPRNPCVLIGECHSSLILATSFNEPSEPLAASIRLEPDPPERGPGSVHEKLPQIDISSFAD